MVDRNETESQFDVLFHPLGERRIHRCHFLFSAFSKVHVNGLTSLVHCSVVTCNSRPATSELLMIGRYRNAGYFVASGVRIFGLRNRENVESSDASSTFGITTIVPLACRSTTASSRPSLDLSCLSRDSLDVVSGEFVFCSVAWRGCEAGCTGFDSTATDLPCGGAVEQPDSTSRSYSSRTLSSASYRASISFPCRTRNLLASDDDVLGPSLLLP